MKILYILNSTALSGGSNKSFMPLLEGMKDKGVDVCVVVPDTDGIYGVLNEMGIRTIVVRMKHNVYPAKVGIKGHVLFVPRIFGRLVLNGLALRKLKRIFRKEGVDIIHTNVSVIKLGFSLAAFMKVSHIYHIREYVGKNHNLRFFP